MYFVINKTKKNITIGDISLNLGPRQAIDLQKIMKKELYENSRHLKIAQRNGDIEIRISRKESKETGRVTTQKDNTKENMEKMKNDIVKEIKNELKNINTGEVDKDILSRKELVEIMTEVMKNLPKEKIIKETTIIKGEKEGEFDDEKVEINEELLGEINKRVIEKMVKNVKSEEIKYKEEKKKDDIMDNVNELENLLG